MVQLSVDADNGDAAPVGYFGNFGINVLDPLAKVFTPTRKIHHLISNSKEDRGKLYQKSGLNYPDKACGPDISRHFHRF